MTDALKDAAIVVGFLLASLGLASAVGYLLGSIDEGDR